VKKEMEQEIRQTNSKGGRPKKVLKRNIALTVKCNTTEQTLITLKARETQLTVSEYLRTLGLNGKIDTQNKALPQEVLQFTSTLNHLAANINQIAKQCNTYHQLTFVERIELQALVIKIKHLAGDIKNYLK
jgi:hypothetical protein